ncbi:MAG TPA: DUF4198 domain-containing protein [Candidatus Binataceae bacterium]|jgi:uncharacterized GH25 family protein|nr:DUF4198 domain-containing protein [Candidatus Binataceae bacterium]
MKVLAAVMAMLTLGAGAARAHDLVLLPEGRERVTVKFGHPQEYAAPDAEKLIELMGYFAGGGAPVSLLSAVGGATADHVTVDTGRYGKGHELLLVWGEYDNGYFASDAAGRYFNTSKLHLPAARDSGAFFKFAKAIFPAAEAGGEFSRVLGEELEIIPQSDPFKTAPGAELPVKVLYRGKPLAGVGVEIGDGQIRIAEAAIPRYQTNPAGIARVPIGKAGLKIIAVDYRTPPRFPQLSDHDDYGATLSFVLSPARQ